MDIINSLDEIKQVQGICGTNAILFHKGKLIVCWNKYRNNWELPGGGKEKGEDLKQCIIREVSEEICQTVEDLQLCCLYRVFVPRIKKEILGTTFHGEVNEITTFYDNEEMRKMALWDMREDIGDMDEVDMKIVELVLHRRDSISIHK